MVTRPFSVQKGAVLGFGFPPCLLYRSPCSETAHVKHTVEMHSWGDVNFWLTDVGSGNSEPLFPEILTRSDIAGKASSKSR